jgi:hypothetical protein
LQINSFAGFGLLSAHNSGWLTLFGVGAARLRNGFTNLSNGVEPPCYPQAATKQITAKNREPC